MGYMNNIIYKKLNREGYMIGNTTYGSKNVVFNLCLFIAFLSVCLR